MGATTERGVKCYLYSAPLPPLNETGADYFTFYYEGNDCNTLTSTTGWSTCLLPLGAAEYTNKTKPGFSTTKPGLDLPWFC